MLPTSTLTMSHDLHTSLKAHLFCGDGRESAAIVLCARTPGPRLRLLAKQALLVPNEACAVRRTDQITWPGEYLEKAIDIAEAEGLAIVLIHSHPGGFMEFSLADDRSDQAVIPTLFQAVGDMHGTAIMMPDGLILARLYDKNMDCKPVELVSVLGDDLQFWWNDGFTKPTSERPAAFTSSMTRELNRLSAVVIGVSGTGSPVAEQLARLGFGRLVLIDPDHVEPRNLNRILNSGNEHANDKSLKVDMFAESVEKHRGAGVVHSVPASIATRKAVLAASQGDVIFCCTDTVEARYIADLMCNAFLIPLFDIGVVIPTKQSAGRMCIIEAYGRIDYVQPGRASLLDRNVYTPASLEAEYLKLVAPSELQQRIEAGYLPGANEEAPAVITLNMRAASVCLSEFINRAYPFGEPNRKFARVSFSIGDREHDFDHEETFTVKATLPVARGDVEPLLGLPALKAPSERKVA